MDILAIFGLQLVLSLILYALLARWYAAPWLANKPIHVALTALIVPHATRHLGLAFLVPGLVAEGLPRSFALQAAYGDLASGLLALVSLVALRRRWGLALPIVWLFNTVGALDLINALRQADAVPYLSTTWYVPTFWVPLLLVTHAMIFARLLRHSGGSRPVATLATLFLILAASPSALSAQAGPEAGAAPAISAEFPFESRFVTVLGSRMHYVDEGEGAPILFLHGNPTSSYLWRNVMPHLAGQGRLVALDLIGMGQSEKPDIGYTYADHIRYVEGFIEALDLKDITLVLHDWGSALGFDYASRHPGNVSGIAFMEAIVPPAAPVRSYEAMGPVGARFRAWRTPGTGEQLILEQNQFVEQVLGGTAVVRKLTADEMAYYRAPYPDAASRKPTLVWPREMPIAAAPARNVRLVERYSAWMTSTRLPMIHFWARPGALNPEPVAQWLVQHIHNLDSVFVGRGVHFIQEDHPEVIGRAIADWMRRNVR